MRLADHIAHKYARSVVTGKTLACEYIQLACRRYLDDLKNAKDRGIYFSRPHAEHVIDFFHLFIRHSKGDFAGQTFTLEPWQQFQLWNLFGWMRKDEEGARRRFRISYTEIPRKNGKTTLAAGINLYMTFSEGEAVAESYFAATKRDQARIGFDEAQRMIKQSPELRKRIKVQAASIFDERTQSKVQPLSSDTNSLDALNIHCGIIDELHAHKTDEIVNVLRTSTGSRRQPLIYEITTAGQSENSICYNHRQYTIDVLKGKIDDDSWFGMIFTLDEGDDYTNHKVWKKANPNLGISKKTYYLKQQVHESTNNPAYQNTVKRLDFNLWGGVTERWMPEGIWRKRSLDLTLEDLITHFDCRGGLDLASTRDFTALGLYFSNETHHHFMAKVWCPEKMVDDRVKKQNIGFDVWVQKGFIRTTPGSVMDTDSISADVIAYCDTYQVKSIAYDRALAYSGTVQNLLNAGIELHPQPQTLLYMSEPTKKFEKMLLSEGCTTDGSPVLDWMLGNVQLNRDPNDNIKVNKAKSIDKVDGVVACIMALAEKMGNDFEQKEKSVYDNDTPFC